MAGLMDANALAGAQVGAEENILNLGSGMAASLAGGLAYIPAAIAGGDAAGQHVKSAVENQFTYQPKTEHGVAQVEARHGLMSPVVKGIDTASNAIGNAAANTVGLVTENEQAKAAAYAAGKTAIPAAIAAIPMMHGGRLIGGSDTVTFHAGRVEGGAPFTKFSNERLQRDGESNRYGPGLYTYIDKSNAIGFADEVVAGTLKTQRGESGGQEAHIYRIKVSSNNNNTIFSDRNYSGKSLSSVAQRLEKSMPGISGRLSGEMSGDQIISTATSYFRKKEGAGTSLLKPRKGEVGPKSKANAALVASGFRYIHGKIPRPDSNGAWDSGLIVLSPETGGAKIVNTDVLTSAPRYGSSAVLMAPLMAPTSQNN